MNGAQSNPNDASAAGSTPLAVAELSIGRRWLVLAAAFMAWMFAGMEISLFVLIARPAMVDMLASTVEPAEIEKAAAQWFAWFQCAFLLGAAAGGWVFGALGDRSGRTRAMGASVLCYSVVTGIQYFAADPYTLLALRFVACMGIGGVWPNAVALAVEGLPRVSRPLLAGLMGTAANVGFVLLGVICVVFPATPEAWRWVLLVGAAPALLGVFSLVAVPESPRWLAGLSTAAVQAKKAQPVREILRPPLLSRTIIGICLGGIPVIGTAANANWLIPWSDQVAAAQAKEVDSASDGETSDQPQGDPTAKARTQILRSGGAVFGSLLGGWIATLLGRRLTYFLISLASFGVSSYIYGLLTPADESFKTFTFLLGFVGVTYFGWLPLYLPELFPTRVRTTGTGVTFNSGRILAAIGVLGAGVMVGLFQGDYARVGTFTGLIYPAGMVVICFAPDTSKARMED
ncbi:MAG: MFS transporter [Planctomycetota bacterium]|mgnify:CR=1 FL=1|nr:MAG: MFS transporter [Planctomycetota bacterium]